MDLRCAVRSLGVQAMWFPKVSAFRGIRSYASFIQIHGDDLDVSLTPRARVSAAMKARHPQSRSVMADCDILAR